jgi:hypothetical protein
MSDALVELVNGNKGSGKSYFGALRIYHALVQGRYVISNVSIEWDQLKKEAADRHGVELEDDQFFRLDETNVKDWEKHVKRGTRENHVLMVLDELHLFFKAHDWSKTRKTHESTLDLLTQMRKLHCDLVILIQDMDTLDKNFRRMTDVFWFLRNMGKWKIPLGPIKLSYPFNHQLQVAKPMERGVVQKTELVKKFHTYQKWVWGIYKSEALAKSLNVDYEVKEVKKLKKVEKKKKRLPLKYALPVVSMGLAVIILGWTRNGEQTPVGETLPEVQQKGAGDQLSPDKAEHSEIQPIKQIPQALKVSGCYKIGNRFSFIEVGKRWRTVPSSAVIWRGPKHFEYSGNLYSLKHEKKQDDRPSQMDRPGVNAVRSLNASEPGS